MGRMSRLAAVGVLLVVAFTLAACSSSPKHGSGSKSGSKSGSTTSSTAAKSPTTTTIAPAVKNTLTSAVTDYESAHGLNASQYTVGRLEVSGVDSSWALFTILPAGGQATLQGGYGFAHLNGATWSVVGFGSAEVGCPPGASGNKLVPAPVLAGFHLSCATTPS